MYEVDTTALRMSMAENGFNSITDLATATGVSRNTLTKVLSGKSFPSSSVMQSLADVLHLDGTEAGRIFFTRKLA